MTLLDYAKERLQNLDLRKLICLNFPPKFRYSMIKNRFSLPQSATQPFLVSSRNVPPHQFIYSGEGHCVMTLKTAMQQTKPPLYLYHLNCFCPAHFKALLKLATLNIFNLSRDPSFFIRQGGWWDLMRGGGVGCQKCGLKGGQAKKYWV